MRLSLKTTPRLALLVLLAPLVAACSGGSSRLYSSGGGNALKLSFDSASILRVADSVREAGDYASAIRFYNQAQRADPTAVAPLLGLAETYSAAGAHDRARVAFDRVLLSHPDNADARLGRANSLLSLGRPRAALRELGGLLAQNPGNPRLYNSLGIARDLLGEGGAAQVRYGQGLDLDPADRALRGNLALSFALSGEYETAIALLRALAREPAADARIRQNLALAYGLADELGLAEAVARMDLPEDSVRSNLNYYAAIRLLEPRRRAIAVLLGPDALENAAMEEEEYRPAPVPPKAPPIALAEAPTGVTSAAATPAEEAPPGPYRLQLATYGSREMALVAWEVQLRRNEDLLDGLEPEIREFTPAGEEDPKYRLETVYRGVAVDAAEFCGRLAERGMTCQIASN